MSTADMPLRLDASAGLDVTTGVERQYRARMAGLRTPADLVESAG